MWILPKQLHISAYVPDMEALNLDLNESSQLCAQLLFVRSKPSPLRTWSQKWKRDLWTRHLSGRILKPSHGQSFLNAWTSSLEVTPASHSVQPDLEKEQTTPDISGLTSQRAFAFFDQSSASSKMSKDTSALDCEKSLENWKNLVTKRRGEYSARLKLARLTSESECLSWPTCAARDYKGTSPGYLLRADGKSRVDQLPVAVDQAEAGNWPTPTVQEAGKIGNQANHGQLALSNHPALRGEVTREKFEKSKHGPPAQDNHNTHGSRPELWQTPDVGSVAGGRSSRGQSAPEKASLEKQTKAWATPRAEMDSGAHRGKPDTLHSQIKAWATPRTKDAEGWMMNQARLAEGKPEDTLTGQALNSDKNNGKLNPRWVETLMGLPVGWTMPNCASPVTIAQTSCASSATE